jgi:hypothetical protein
MPASSCLFSRPTAADWARLSADTAVIGTLACASTSITNYPFLTTAAANLLTAFGFR